jgi:hypothetical protein
MKVPPTDNAGRIDDHAKDSRSGNANAAAAAPTKLPFPELLQLIDQAGENCFVVAMGCDVEALSLEEAESLLRSANAIINKLSTYRCLLSSKIAEAKTFRAEGHRSPAHQLANRGGTTLGRANKNLKTAEALKKLPRFFDLAVGGDLSQDQLDAIADAAVLDPRCLDALVDAAKDSSLFELREMAAKIKTEASNPEDRRREIHDNRYLRTYMDSDGGFNLKFRDNPEVGAQIMAVISPIADSLFQEACGRGVQEHTDAHRADALSVLASFYGASGGSSVPVSSASGGSSVPNSSASEGSSVPVSSASGGSSVPNSDARPLPKYPSRPKVIVRVDLPTLLRGYPVSGETCEIAGFGPVALSAVEEMLSSGSCLLEAVITDGEAVAGVVNFSRRLNSKQVTALEWLYPTCGAKGCGASTHLEFDHREDWSKTHFTLVELCDRLCSFHHDLKSRQGWMLVEGRGKRDFVPPSDPRHPKWKARGTGAGSATGTPTETGERAGTEAADQSGFDREPAEPRAG